MSGGQVAALIVAILLLLPGGCFLILGISMTTEAHPDTIDRELGPTALLVGGIILSVMGFLFWVAFRRRKSAPSPPSLPPADDSQGG